jgi:hypothetical protein
MIKKSTHKRPDFRCTSSGMTRVNSLLLSGPFCIMKNILLLIILFFMLVVCFTACSHDNRSAEALKQYEAESAQIKSHVAALESKLAFENELGAINNRIK